jgi:hypothetical protein
MLKIVRSSNSDRKSLTLSVDPTVESVQLRQRVEVLRCWRNFLLSSIPLVAAIVWLVASKADRLEASIATSLATGLVGIQLDRLLDARRGRDDFYRDVIALTSVFYQSPATIRDFLGKESIDKSIANLLKAALQSDELGMAYWQQSVKPFIDFGDRGFKEDWCYTIDLCDLDRDIEVKLSDEELLRLSSSDYRRLTTSLAYHQTVMQPADTYWVACAFELETIPAWFREPNFLLREVVPLSIPAREQLSRALSQTEGEDRRARTGKSSQRARREDEVQCAIAKQIFDARVRIDGQDVSPDCLHADEEGIRWGFALNPELQRSLKSSLEIHVEVRTLQARGTSYFPVVINTPTRHPTIRFSYGMCDSIQNVESEVFFSAERPYDDGLRVMSPENKRIEVQTKREDWVLGGSGCVFIWDER